MAKPEKEEAEPEREAGTDGPLLDLSDDAVKKMIKAAKKRGYVTMDELNSVLPSEEVTSEQIEDTMSMLSDMGINVVEDEEVGEEAEPADPAADAEEDANELAEQTGTAVAATPAKKEPTDRTDDPVRMYLREMGSVELLSREGEIAIAKRIEAGRETMIAGLCESPLTFQAIIIWRDELNEAKILLREIIDLEATYAGPEAKQAPVVERTEEIEKQRVEDRDRLRRPVRDDDDITNVGGEARARGGRGRGRRAEPVAGGHGSRAQAAGHGDPRRHRRHLQEAQQAAGPAGREPARRDRHAVAQPGAPLQAAQGRADHGGEVAVAQHSAHRGAGRAALRHQQAAGAERGQAAAPGRKLRRAAARSSCANIRAPSSTPTG